jgi:hypothetical protein
MMKQQLRKPSPSRDWHPREKPTLKLGPQGEPPQTARKTAKNQLLALHLAVTEANPRCCFSRCADDESLNPMNR